jgi:hypothetical protein
VIYDSVHNEYSGDEGVMIAYDLSFRHNSNCRGGLSSADDAGDDCVVTNKSGMQSPSKST